MCSNSAAVCDYSNPLYYHECGCEGELLDRFAVPPTESKITELLKLLRSSRRILRFPSNFLPPLRRLNISNPTHFDVVSFAALENRIMRQDRTGLTELVGAIVILY